MHASSVLCVMDLLLKGVPVVHQTFARVLRWTAGNNQIVNEVLRSLQQKKASKIK